MEYVSNYISPLGKMLLAADDKGLTGAWFEGQKYFARGLGSAYEAVSYTHLTLPTILRV